MRTHVKVLGVLQLIFGSFALLLALGVGLGMSLLGGVVSSQGEPDAQVGGAVLGMVGVAAGAFLGLGGAFGVITGIGLLTMKSWARIVGIICSALSLISFPFGTILGVYGLWVLFNKETEQLFATGGAPPVQNS